MIRTLLQRTRRVHPVLSCVVFFKNQGNISSLFPHSPVTVPLRHFCATQKPPIGSPHCPSFIEPANGDALNGGSVSECTKEALPTNAAPNGCQEGPLPVLRYEPDSVSTSNKDKSCESLSSHEADYDTDLTSSFEDEMDYSTEFSSSEFSSSGFSSSEFSSSEFSSSEISSSELSSSEFSSSEAETDDMKSSDEEKIDMDTVPDDLKEMLQEGYVLESVEEDGLPIEESVELLTTDEVKQVLEEVRARDVQIFPVNDRCEWTDTMVVATGISDRHVRGIADALVYKIKKKGQVESSHYPTVEGQVGGNWLVVDCGNIVIHVLNEESRAYYKLEDLWTGNARPSTADEDLETMLKKTGLKEVTSSKKN